MEIADDFGSDNSLHDLTYHGRNDLIRSIPHDVIQKIILQPDDDGETASHIAAKLKNFDLLTLFIEMNPETIYCKNKLGVTPFYYLVDNPDYLKNIIDKFSVSDYYLKHHYTIIEFYIITQNIDMVKFLLDHIKINELTNRALFTIIYSENSDTDKIKLIQLLIDHDMDINLLNEYFYSPIIISVHLNNYAITKFLLQSGADPNYYGPQYDHHPLTMSIIRNNEQITNILLDYDTNVNITDKYLRTPVHYLFLVQNDFSIQTKIQFLNRIASLNMLDINLDSILNLIIHHDKWQHYQNIFTTRKLKIYVRNRDGVAPIDGIKIDEMDDFLDTVQQSYSAQLDKPDMPRESIIKKIINGDSYPTKKNHQVFKIIKTMTTNMTHYSPYTYNYICFLYYILNKYPTIKIPSMGDNIASRKALYQELTADYQDKTYINGIFRSIIKDYINHSSMLINHIIIWENVDSYFFSPYIVQGIYATIKKYPDVDFILLKLSIITNRNFNHANMLIYDVKNRYVERFDPYGNVPFIDNEMIDNVLESFFKDYFPHIKYIPSNKIINSISVQLLSDENNSSNYAENDPVGFCVAWCIWYIEMRINNPRWDSHSLITRSIYQINKMETIFKNYIRNYSDYLDTEKNNILDLVGVPKKYWYMRNIPTLYYRAYLKHIRNLYSAIV